MRIVFFAPFCLLRPTTNRIFDVRLCDALAGSGAEVELVHPHYHMKENIGEGELDKVYGTRNRIRFHMLRTNLRESHAAVRQAAVLVFAFAWQAMLLMFRGGSRKTVIMSRDIKILMPAVLLRKLSFGAWKPGIVVHVHEVRKDGLSRWVYRHADGIWTTTEAAANRIQVDYGVKPERFQSICACLPPEGAVTREEARRLIHYNDARPLVVYTGKLGRGIVELEYILDAAAMLPDVNFLFTGGKDDTLAYMKELCASRRLTNVHFSGFIREVAFVRNYQAAADVLVSYYSAGDHAVEYNLPQKLMEYMFSGNPVVTPDFPASRPFVNRETACIVEPDNYEALAKGIRSVLSDPVRAQQMARQAQQAVKDLTFEKKAAGWLQSLEVKA